MCSIRSPLCGICWCFAGGARAWECIAAGGPPYSAPQRAGDTLAALLARRPPLNACHAPCHGGVNYWIGNHLRGCPPGLGRCDAPTLYGQDVHERRTVARFHKTFSSGAGTADAVESRPLAGPLGTRWAPLVPGALPCGSWSVVSGLAVSYGPSERCTPVPADASQRPIGRGLCLSLHYTHKLE